MKNVNPLVKTIYCLQAGLRYNYISDDVLSILNSVPKIDHARADLISPEITAEWILERLRRWTHR